MFKMTGTLCVAAMAALVAPAFAAEWMTDLEAARAKAAAEGKVVLVDFTGSDWCGWCIRLKKNIFDKPSFDEYVKDKFVLMEVDVPNNPKFDRALLQRNRELCERYQVSGFPTIMVLTPEGEVAGGFVGGRASLAEVQAPLDAALANVAALKAAEGLEGEAQLQALHAVYKQLPEEMRAISSLRERIAALDTADATGIRADMAAEKQMKEVYARLQAAGRDGAALLAVVNEALENALPQNRAAILEAKVGIQLMVAETEEDVLAAKKTMLEMAEADAEHADAIRTMVEQRFADPAKVLQMLKKNRR